jgi:hypothetical protein
MKLPLMFKPSVQVGLLMAVVICGPQLLRAETATDDLLNILDGKGAVQAVTAAPTPSGLAPLLSAAGAPAQAVLTAFEKNDFARALRLWPDAFAGTAFEKSPDGQAFYALLLLKNNLPVNAIETLFAIHSPDSTPKAAQKIEQNIALYPALVQLWRESISDASPAWESAQIKWSPEWTNIFGVATEVRVLARNQYSPEQIAELKDLIKQTTLGTPERAQLEWQLVTSLSLGNQAADAAKVLAHLMKTPANPIHADVMTITAARLLFQNGYLDAALSYYGKIPKSSELWVEAQEESAWSQMRKGQPQNVLALTQTLQNPVLRDQVGAETFVLRSIAQLKLCDYPGVLESLRKFKTQFRNRALAMQTLKENPRSPAVVRMIEKQGRQELTLRNLGADAHMLPRYITRDFVLQDLISASKVLQEEARRAEHLFTAGQTTADETRKNAGSQLTDVIKARAQAAQTAVSARVQLLAGDELSEISTQLQKMHIVEAEVLQNVVGAEKRIAAAKPQVLPTQKGTTGSQARDQLTFPAERETWLDELSNFKVDVSKACQAKASQLKKEVL